MESDVFLLHAFEGRGTFLFVDNLLVFVVADDDVVAVVVAVVVDNYC